MIRASGNSLRIETIASRPFISGICKSIRVTSGGLNREFHLRTGIDLTPNSQVTSHTLSAFAHSIQPPVSCAHLPSQKLRVNAPSIIPNPHAKLPFVVSDFHLDLTSLAVPE